jgi:hypothetical protein
MSLRVLWRGCHREEDLAIGIACDPGLPPLEPVARTHTHIHTSGTSMGESVDRIFWGYGSTEYSLRGSEMEETTGKDYG